MVKIKKFYELNETFFYFSDYVDLDLLQEIIEHMRPKKLDDNNRDFKISLMEFNDKYPVKEQKRMPVVFGKQVAWWIDLNLMQDVIDRMNPVSCKSADDYKKDLKKFLS